MSQIIYCSQSHTSTRSGNGSRCLPHSDAIILRIVVIARNWCAQRPMLKADVQQAKAPLVRVRCESKLDPRCAWPASLLAGAARSTCRRTQHAPASSPQHAAPSTQHAARSTQHAAPSKQHAAPSKQEVDFEQDEDGGVYRRAEIVEPLRAGSTPGAVPSFAITNAMASFASSSCTDPGEATRSGRGC
jgi:hypothetical protein